MKAEVKELLESIPSCLGKMYNELCVVGFSQEQAFQIVRYCLAVVLVGAPGEVEDE